MPNGIINVSAMGDAFVPRKYFSQIYEKKPIRSFIPDKNNTPQLIRFIKNDGTVVLNGVWLDAAAFYRYIIGRSRDIWPKLADRIIRLERQILLPISCVPFFAHLYNEKLLAGFLGEPCLPEDIPVLVQMAEAIRLSKCLEEPFYSEPIDIDLVIHPDVLTPKSNETIQLMCKAIDLCHADLPIKARILDMGCGSGVLSIAVHQICMEKEPNLFATDILPEAVATTRYNAYKAQAAVHVYDAGDLFHNLPGEMFDLIIFNAPWVAEPAKNISEVALKDEHQNTIDAFLNECGSHILQGGKIIIGYSDHSGAGAMEHFENSIRKAGLMISQVLKDRIKTHRSIRQWQNVFAYILRKGGII